MIIGPDPSRRLPLAGGEGAWFWDYAGNRYLDFSSQLVNANLGLSPATEGQVIRLRIPELNEERRKELVKVAHKYAESARVAVRPV